MIKALVFDFDGLILDTEVPDYRAWQEIFHEHGHDLPLSVWSECIGRAGNFFDPIDHLQRLEEVAMAPQLGKNLGRLLDREALLARQRARHQELIEAEAPLPGIEDYVKEARRAGLKLGIASSSKRDWVAGHLHRLNLSDSWDCIRCWGEVERAKPNPDLYLAALESLEVHAEEAVAFEDSPNGIQAAKDAGIFCVAVPNPLTDQLDLSLADIRLKSLRDLPLAELLERIESSRAFVESPVATP
jgi:HAD superfamily hydrolase (TIGR01509 family)